MLISGFGRRGKAKGDIPGVRFKVVKVSGVGLLALWKEKKVCCLFSCLLCLCNMSCRRSQDHEKYRSLPFCAVMLYCIKSVCSSPMMLPFESYPLSNDHLKHTENYWDVWTFVNLRLFCSLLGSLVVSSLACIDTNIMIWEVPGPTNM